MTQMHAPVAGQPWLSSGAQGGLPVTPVQQTGQQPPVTSPPDAVSASDGFSLLSMQFRIDAVAVFFQGIGLFDIIFSVIE